MENYPIALFGEAEKGDFGTAYYLQSLPQAVDCLGNPPPSSKGLLYAVQSLLYHKDLLFFRVKEEGYSFQDYYFGLHFLKADPNIHLSAICMPGVGDKEVIDQVIYICNLYKIILITNEPDLYDYLTSSR